MTVKVTFDGEWKQDIIKKSIRFALESENISFDTEIEVVIVSEDEIRSLNNETRGIDRVTDVLSFPMFESVDEAVEDAEGNVFLGSMVICKEKAEQQADEYGHSIDREVAFLSVHSVLHLLGYDHELGEKEEKEMFQKQEKVLTDMGLIR